MKRELFNVADEEFAVLLERTGASFDKEEIKYMFVGGVATQSHIADYLCTIHNMPLLELIKSGKIRVQDCFRSTDDIDIAVRMGEDKESGERGEIEARKKIYKVLDNIVHEGEFFSPSGEHIVSIALARRGHVKPEFQIDIDELANPDMIASFNIYRRPKDLGDANLSEFEDKFYDVFLERAVRIAVPYCKNKSIAYAVKNPADLLATKIVRGRDKDMSDALALARFSRTAGKSIDYKEVEGLLCRKDVRYGLKPNPFLVERYEAFRKLEEALGAE